MLIRKKKCNFLHSNNKWSVDFDAGLKSIFSVINVHTIHRYSFLFIISHFYVIFFFSFLCFFSKMALPFDDFASVRLEWAHSFSQYFTLWNWFSWTQSVLSISTNNEWFYFQIAEHSISTASSLSIQLRTELYACSPNVAQHTISMHLLSRFSLTQFVGVSDVCFNNSWD